MEGDLKKENQISLEVSNHKKIIKVKKIPEDKSKLTKEIRQWIEESTPIINEKDFYF